MITGKVADLIDERTLVINKGKNDGVVNGMRFMVYAAEGKKIKDPDTDKEIGVLKIPKIAVEITKVEDAYSLAETYHYKTINEGGSNTAFGNITGYLSPPKYVRKYETFAIEEQTKKTIDEQRSIVKIGDIAEQIQEERVQDESREE
jgi:capsid portal protein